MRLSILPSVLLTLATVTNTVSAFKRLEGTNDDDSSNFLPGRYIIEVDASPAHLAKRQESADALLDNVLEKIPRVKTRKTYKNRPDLFQGASIKVSTSLTAEDILAIDGVHRVWPVRTISVPTLITSPDGGGKGYSGKPITADQLERNAVSNNASLFSRALGSSPNAGAYAKDTWSPHVMTGVDKAHKANLMGQGVKIGILDSGVDYKNPYLGGCFGSGCRISFGYDFVGDDYSPGSDPVPDSDPYTDCNIHGTHVAGIIGATANKYGFSGVAPKSTLGMYRIFGCSGTGTEDILIEALLRAASDNCDVINLSFGTPAGWMDSGPAQSIVRNLNAQGIITVAATGNTQGEGAFWGNSPAAADTGLSIGSVDVASLPAFTANVLLRGSIPVLSATPLPTTKTYLVYFLSTSSSTTSDGCSELPSSTPDLTDRIVIIQRGGCDFYDKLNNVFNAGGTIALIYNSLSGDALPYFGTADSGLDYAGGLRREDGLKLLSWYKQNPRSLRMNFPTGPFVNGAVDTKTGGQLSSFSNYGPTYELFNQPTFSAPGGNILSTIPLSQGGLGILSGTSMASPFAAGAAAVILSARASEKLTPAQVASLLTTTASRIPVKRGTTSPFTTVLLQGGGLVQVDKAIEAKTLIVPSQLQLNDTAYFQKTKTITLVNRGSKAVTYTFSSSLGQGIGTYDKAAKSAILPSVDPLEITSARAARVAFSRSSLTIAAGGRGSVAVTFTPPSLSAANTARAPLYSGWLIIKGGSESYSVPYFGLAARMYDLPVLDTTTTYASYMQDGLRYPFLSDGYSAQTGTGTQAYTKADGLYIYYRFAQGTRFYTVDLVLANIAFTPTIATSHNSRFVRRSITSPHDTSLPSTSLTRRATPAGTGGRLYSTTKIVGRLFTGQSQTRNAATSSNPYGFSDIQKTFNGKYQPNPNNAATLYTAVNNRQYRILIRALKITGNPRYEQSYESWLSPPFSFSS